MVADTPKESPKKNSEFSHHPRLVATHFKFEPKIQRKSANLAPFFKNILFWLLFFTECKFQSAVFVADLDFSYIFQKHP